MRLSSELQSDWRGLWIISDSEWLWTVIVNNVSINGDATQYKGLYMKNYWLERFMVGVIVLNSLNSIRMNLKTLKFNIYTAYMQKKPNCWKKTVFFVFFWKKTCFFLQKKHHPKKTVFCPSLVLIGLNIIIFIFII